VSVVWAAGNPGLSRADRAGRADRTADLVTEMAADPEAVTAFVATVVSANVLIRSAGLGTLVSLPEPVASGVAEIYAAVSDLFAATVARRGAA
jgi:hypothetical protein